MSTSIPFILPKSIIPQQNIDPKDTSKIEIQEDLHRKIQTFVCEYDLTGRFDLASLLCLKVFNKLLYIPLKKNKIKERIAQPGLDMLQSQFFPIFIKLLISLKIEKQRKIPPTQEFYTNKKLSSELKKKLEHLEENKGIFNLKSPLNKGKFEETKQKLQLLIDILNEDNAFEILGQETSHFIIHSSKPNDINKQFEQLKQYSQFITYLISRQEFNKFSKPYLIPIIKQHSNLTNLKTAFQTNEIKIAYTNIIISTTTMSQLMYEEIQQEKDQSKEEEQIFDLQVKEVILIFILDFNKCKIQVLEQLFLQQKPGYRSSIELSEKFFSLLQRYAKKLHSKKVTKNLQWQNFEAAIFNIENCLNAIENELTASLSLNFWKKEVLDHDSFTMTNILIELFPPLLLLKNFYKAFENIPGEYKKELESLILKANKEDCEDVAAYLVKRLSSHRVFILIAALFHINNLIGLSYLDKGNLDAPDAIKEFFHWLNELQENAQKISKRAKKKKETTSICSSMKEKEELEESMNSEDTRIQENASELKEQKELTANPSFHEKSPHRNTKSRSNMKPRHNTKPRKFEQFLKDLGFTLKSQNGSHQHYEDPNGRHFLYTPHRERQGFKPGTFHAMMDSLKV